MKLALRFLGAVLLLVVVSRNGLMAQSADAAAGSSGRSADMGASGEAAVRALVARQAEAWEKQDFHIGAADWLPDGELTSPGGRVTANQLEATINDYSRSFRDLKVTVKNVFVSKDGKKAAIEWDWAVTRRRDGVRGVTHDAILVDLQEGKIKSWREYFDFMRSVDANP